MAQVKIEITFDPCKETLKQALAALQNEAMPEAAKPAETGGVTTAATTGPKSGKPKTDKTPTAAATDKTTAPAETEGKDAAPVAETEPSASPSEETVEEKPVSKTDVRAVATALSKAGKRDELQAIFKEFGATKLSEIKEADYPALMRKLVAVNG